MNNNYCIYGANGYDKKDATSVEVLKNGTILHVTEYYNNIASPDNVRTDFYIDYSHPLMKEYLKKPIEEIKDNYFNHLIKDDLVGLTYKYTYLTSSLSIYKISKQKNYIFDSKKSVLTESGLYKGFVYNIGNNSYFEITYKNNDSIIKDFNNEMFKE